MEDSGSPIIATFIVFLIFILLDAILYAYGSAIQSISENDIEKREKKGDIRKARQILAFKNDPNHSIYTIQIAANLMGILTGSVVVQTVSGEWYAFFTELGAAAFISGSVIHILTKALAIVTFLFLLYTFGVHIPKILGAYYAENTAFRLIGPIHIIMAVFHPFTWLVIVIVNVLMKILRIDLRKLQEDVTEEEIISMVNEGHEQGVLEASEAEMIHNIFELGDKEAQDIMIHRKNIVAVNGTLTLMKALNFILDKTNTRLPVYENTIDNITGIIHLKDAVKFHATDQYDNWLIKDIPGLIRSPVFIPETRNINELFKSMQSKKIQMVIVLDEYGQTAGLIALEDILEEIVGNILDEYDIEEIMIEPCGDTSYLMSGMTPLEEVEDTLGIELDLDGDIETLNGFLISRLDKIPSEDEHTTIEEMGFAFQILSVANKTIEKVRVTRLQENNSEENTEV